MDWMKGPIRISKGTLELDYCNIGPIKKEKFANKILPKFSTILKITKSRRIPTVSYLISYDGDGIQCDPVIGSHLVTPKFDLLCYEYAVRNYPMCENNSLVQIVHL